MARRWRSNEAIGCFRFANGFVVHTDPFMRRDAGRVLPVGGPQDMVMNRLVNRPEIVAGKRGLDAFSGSRLSWRRRGKMAKTRARTPAVRVPHGVKLADAGD